MSFAVFQVDATPVKRLFMSIIADYDFKTSICELIDNAIDHWNFGGKKRPLIVKVFLDWDRQMITVEDNAGGVPKDQIAFLVQPGASRQIVDQELIGNFGVGGKRAGVALGSRTEVTTQHGNGVAHKFVLDDDWLSKESWNVEIEEISSFSEGTTKVRISELRQGLDGTQIDFLKRHFSEIYAKFISNDWRLYT